MQNEDTVYYTQDSDRYHEEIQCLRDSGVPVSDIIAGSKQEAWDRDKTHCGSCIEVK